MISVFIKFPYSFVDFQDAPLIIKKDNYEAKIYCDSGEILEN
jgi:hypothetical protein